MHPRLSPPGKTDDSHAGRGFPWVLLAAAVLLLAVLFVVLILPAVVSPLPRSDHQRLQTHSQAATAAHKLVDSQVHSDDLHEGDVSTPSTAPGAIGSDGWVQNNGPPGSHGRYPLGGVAGLGQQGLSDTSEAADGTLKRDSNTQQSGQSRGSGRVEQAPAEAVTQTEGSQQHFLEAMSRAQKALQKDDFVTARQALDQAESAKPGSPAAGELRRQLAAAVLARQLRDLATRAAGSERQARWQDALDAYDQALRLDPSAAFARTGRQRVSDRLALEQAIDHYLQDPARLQSPVALGNAKRLLRQLESLKESAPALSASYRRLAGVLAEAEMTLDVTILSDGATDVVIYPVGKLGRFDKRALRLRPGTYTAVGTRDGFRDVRKVFVLAPGGSLDITVRCEEAI